MGGRAASRSALAALAALALGLGAAGCGEDGDAAEPAARAVGEARVGNVAALAMCRDWTRANEAQRRATIADIRNTINLKDTPTPTPELSDERAAKVFDKACAERYAAGFRLYKLYAHAASFQRLLPE